MHFKEFVLKTQATNLRDSVMQFDSRLTQLQYAIPYRVTSRYINKDQKALDWGCGNGHFSYFLTSQGIQTIGYSFDEKPTFLNNQPLFTFIKGFKNNPIILPFDDESFDFVFSVGVLEHVYETGGNESQSLNEIVRVLKRGGLFLCFHLPNRYQWIEAIGNTFGIIDHFHKQKYTIKDIRYLTTHSSMILLEWGRYNFFPRNQLARLPKYIKNGTFTVALFEISDRFLGTLFSLLCTNYYFVARKAK